MYDLIIDCLKVMEKKSFKPSLTPTSDTTQNDATASAPLGAVSEVSSSDQGACLY